MPRTPQQIGNLTHRLYTLLCEQKLTYEELKGLGEGIYAAAGIDKVPPGSVKKLFKVCATLDADFPLPEEHVALRAEVEALRAEAEKLRAECKELAAKVLDLAGKSSPTTATAPRSPEPAAVASPAPGANGAHVVPDQVIPPGQEPHRG